MWKIVNILLFRCCGNELSSTTYNLCCLRAMVAFFFIICFVVGCLSIAALIVSSDLQKAFDYTTCNTENIIY